MVLHALELRQGKVELDRVALREQFHALARRNLRNDERTALTTIASRGIIAVPITAAQKALWEALGRQVRQRLTGEIADAALVARVATYAH